MKKKIAAALLAAGMTLASPLMMTAGAEEEAYSTNVIFFYDESATLSADETAAIETMMQDCADTIGFDVGIYIGSEYRSDSTEESFVINDLGITMFGNTPDSAWVSLYIDNEGVAGDAYDYMYAYHDACLYYTDSDNGNRISKIIDHLEAPLPASGTAISSEELTHAITNFCSDLEKYKSMGAEKNAYYQNHESGEFRKVSGGEIVSSKSRPYNDWWKFTFGGLIVGLIISGISVLVVKTSYKNKAPASASAYTSSNNTHFNKRTDLFLGKHTTTRHIERSSSGGGGGGGGSHHSSGGGGGGHR